MRLIGKVLCGFALLVLLGCAETREHSFSSMSTTQAQSMVSRGWIPVMLPSTATDVRVRSNIDTNTVRGMARVPAPDLGRLRAALRPLADDVVPPFWPKGDVTPPWWPADLLPPGRASELRRRGWEVFSVPDRPATYMALHPSDGWVYFWSESS
jgi:hypothetical protein